MNELVRLLKGRRLLIFDFDGTLADTSAMHATAFERVLAPIGVQVDYVQIAGLRTVEAMHKCLAGSGLTLSEAHVDELAAEKQRLVRLMISENLRPLNGVEEFLRWARTRYLMSIATGGSRGTVQLALEKLGYTDWFRPVVCGDDVVRGKPDPEAFLRVLRLTGVAPGEALVFEDADVGFAAAGAAGLEHVDARENLWERLQRCET